MNFVEISEPWNVKNHMTICFVEFVLEPVQFWWILYQITLPTMQPKKLRRTKKQQPPRRRQQNFESLSTLKATTVAAKRAPTSLPMLRLSCSWLLPCSVTRLFVICVNFTT